MTESGSTRGPRPRPGTLVQLDLGNAYSRLGVSPLDSTEEIRRVAEQKRREMTSKRRARGQQEFGAEEVEMTRLQEIQDQIGTARNRARYDRANPQNELLTVQPAPGDRWLDPRHRAALITAWLVEELGRDAALPSPDSLALWAPLGLSAELLAFLREFVGPVDDASPVDAPTAPETPEDPEVESFPGVADLIRSRPFEPSNPESTQEEDPRRV